MPPATAGGSCGCTTDGCRPSRAHRRPAAPAPGAACGGRPAPRPGTPRSGRGRRPHRSAGAVRHGPPRCAARGRGRAGRPHPSRGRRPPAAQRVGAARPGGSGAGGVGHVLRRRRGEAGRGRGRALPRGHRAGGRRPGPRCRRLPRRGGGLPRRCAGPAPPRRSPVRGWSAAPDGRPRSGGERPLRPSARRVRLLHAVRRQPSGRSGRPGRRARHDGAGADRPRRPLRRGEVRPRLPVGRCAPDLRRRPGRRPGPGHRAAPGARPPLGERRAASALRAPAGAGPGPRWGQRRPPAAPGHLPRPGRRRLAVAVPADQRHPSARHAG